MHPDLGGTATAADGVLKFSPAGAGYAKAQRTIDVTVAETRYLKITVDAATNASWKLEIDDVNGWGIGVVSVQGQTTDKGVTYYYDLNCLIGHGGITAGHLAGNTAIIFALYPIGSSANHLDISAFEFVAELPSGETAITF
jgi:hypothetical protein